MPPSVLPGYPGGIIPTAIGMRFRRHGGIYRSDVVQVKTKTKTKTWVGTVPPPVGRPRAQVKERAGRITLFPSSAMSSGRLFLDRVGRHQSPSPLHRHGQHNLIAWSERTHYHRTVSSVLTVCVSSGGKGKRGGASGSTKAVAQAGKDELDGALSELNRSTNRLRRKFDGTDAWIQTKVEVERVMDDGRKINQVVARGKYGAEAARLWAVLRTGMNDLARAYALQPMPM